MPETSSTETQPEGAPQAPKAGRPRRRITGRLALRVNETRPGEREY